MNSETPIATWFGPWSIPVQVMPSLGLLALIFVGLSATGVGGLIDGVIMFAIIVGSILLHEWGHAWGARVQGIPVQRVVLYCGGGFCQHRSAGAQASEFIVIMGPLVNLALWAMLSLASWSIAPVPPPYDASEEALSAFFAAHAMRFELIFWLETAAAINILLFVLNMIPVQPLDGGKLLHLWLLRVLPQDIALAVAGGVGLVFSLLWLPLMLGTYLFFGFFLLFFPSVHMHWEMLRGGGRLRRMKR